MERTTASARSVMRKRKSKYKKYKIGKILKK